MPNRITQIRLLTAMVFGVASFGLDFPHFGGAWPVTLTVPAQAQAQLPGIDIGAEQNRGDPRRDHEFFSILAGMIETHARQIWGGASGGGSGGAGSRGRGGSVATSVGDPINYATGNAYNTENDYVTAGSFPIELSRYYNSQDISRLHFGANWRASYSRSIDFPNVRTARVTRDDGQVLIFTRIVSYEWYYVGPWTPPVYSSYRLYGGGFNDNATLITDEDETESYNASGMLLSVANRAGLVQTIGYDGLNRLSTVKDAFGRTLTLNYNDLSGSISSAQAPDGGVYTYGYDYDIAGQKNRLTSVTYPDGSTRQYLYEDYWHPRAITGVIDENGVRYTSYSYDYYSGRAVTTEHAGGVDRYSVAYPNYSWDPVSVTTPLGAVERFTLTSVQGFAKPLTDSRSCSDCTAGGSGASVNEYDGNGNLTSSTDFNGNKSTFVYDQTRNLQTSKTVASGSSVARTITTEWHPDFRLPKKVVDGGRTFTNEYDAKGNLTKATVATSTSSSVSSYTYNSLGQVLTATDPVGNVTKYDYDAKGNLKSVTDALGHVTAFTSYDANGRPLTIRDPNGVVTTLTYDFRGHVTTSTTLGQTTTYTYDKVGLLTRIQDPSGAWTSFGHDAAHRLTRIRSKSGDLTVYTLDAAGNRIKEEVFDGHDVLMRTHSRTYDGLDRLAKDIGAANQTSIFTYDANDNLVGAKDPNGNATAFAYDAQNRLSSQTEPEDSALTVYGYDANGRLAKVTDPRSLATVYTNNLLDERAKTSSPDSGSTTKTFDAAGNVLTSVDARGKITTYTYDDLNRRKTATYADGSVATYGYDQGAYGIGRLTSLVDSTGTTSWSYDAFGRVVQKIQTTGAITLTTKWSFDSATGLLASVTYPSGAKLTYSYDVAARVRSISLQPPGGAVSTLIGSISYRPFGPVSSWDPGGASVTPHLRSFDLDGRIKGITSSTGNALTYAYEPGSRISSITESGRATKNFYYDRSGRLGRYVTGATTIQYNKDASGNRLSAGGISYTVSPNSNRLVDATNASSGVVQTFWWDQAGDLLSRSGVFALGYDTRNRLARATVGALVTNYGVNDLGQRVTKSGAGGQTEYLYDLSGHLIGTYDGNGDVREEIVWLGDLPVATLQGGAAYYIMPDHLGAPHEIVNSANGQVWFWDHDPVRQWRALGGGRILA